MAGIIYEIYHSGYIKKISRDSGIKNYLSTVDQSDYTSIKYVLDIPALNYKYGNSDTVQPSAIQILILIKI